MRRGDSTAETPWVQGLPGCRVLRNHDEVEAAVVKAKRLGLAPNPQRLKTWDNVLAVELIGQLGLSHDDAIVDLGCRSGILLTWLDQLGYRKLHGCDLQGPFPPVRSALKGRLWRTALVGTRAYVRHVGRMRRAPL